MADQVGYTMYFDGRWRSVPQGDNDDVMMLKAGVPSWEPLPASAAHDILSASHSDTNAGSLTNGDILYVTGGLLDALGIGGEDTVFQVSSGAPAWGALSESQIPNLGAAKVTSGEFADARIPSLAASKITSGEFANARISAGSVTQHLGNLAPVGDQVNHMNPSTAPDLATLVADFNQLLSELQAASVMQ